jgi:hypothetical protein
VLSRVLQSLWFRPSTDNAPLVTLNELLLKSCLSSA